jgi:hypothetical protein
MSTATDQHSPTCRHWDYQACNCGGAVTDQSRTAGSEVGFMSDKTPSEVEVLAKALNTSEEAAFSIRRHLSAAGYSLRSDAEWEALHRVPEKLVVALAEQYMDDGSPCFCVTPDAVYADGAYEHRPRCRLARASLGFAEPGKRVAALALPDKEPQTESET